MCEGRRCVVGEVLTDNELSHVAAGAYYVDAVCYGNNVLATDGNDISGTGLNCLMMKKDKIFHKDNKNTYRLVT